LVTKLSRGGWQFSNRFSEKEPLRHFSRERECASCWNRVSEEGLGPGEFLADAPAVLIRRTNGDEACQACRSTIICFAFARGSLFADSLKSCALVGVVRAERFADEFDLFFAGNLGDSRINRDV
jgi:hypothetical protein